MKDIREELLTESPIKLMFKLCTPAIIGMIVIGLYSFMDGVFAGQIIGEYAMGAISVAFPLTFFNSGISTLIGVGSASILSRAIGKKNQKVIDAIMGNLVAWVLLFSTIIMVVGLVFTRQLLQISGASGQILEMGVRYLRIIFLGSIFVNFAQSANMVMRGEGLMKKAMLIMGFGAILNIILDPILMKAFGDRAIEGAAVATVTSQFIQAVLTLWYFKKKSKVVKINKIKMDKEIQSEMFSIGVSVMMITFFQSIGNGKTAGLLVMFRQVFLFVPAILVLPTIFELSAVWFMQPLVDVIIVVFGIVIMFREYRNMMSKSTCNTFNS